MGKFNRTPTGVVLTGDAQQVAQGTTVIVYAISLHAGTTASSVLAVTGGASGTTLYKLTHKAETVAGDNTDTVSFPEGLFFPDGLYLNLAGTDASVSVSYSTY